MAVWSTQAANEMIAMSLRNQEPLTNMQIQKLVYFSHGWFLYNEDSSLTIDSPEAWDFGPVYRLLWNRLQYAGNYPITQQIPDSLLLPYEGATTEQLGEPAKELIQRVCSFYGELSGSRLSMLTHRTGTPWRKIFRDGEGRNDPIPSKMIKDHFRDLVQQYEAEHK